MGHPVLDRYDFTESTGATFGNASMAVSSTIDTHRRQSGESCKEFMNTPNLPYDVWND